MSKNQNLNVAEESEGLNSPYRGAKESQELLDALPQEHKDRLFKKAIYISSQMKDRMNAFPAPFCEMLDFAVTFGLRATAEEYNLDVERVGEIAESFNTVTQKFVDKDTGIVLYHYALDTAMYDCGLIYKFWAVQRLMREETLGLKQSLNCVNMDSGDYQATRNMMIGYIQSGIYGDPGQDII